MQKTEKHCKNQCFCYHKTTKISPKTGPKTQKSASGPGHLRNRKKRCCKPKHWGQKVEKHGVFSLFACRFWTGAFTNRCLPYCFLQCFLKASVTTYQKQEVLAEKCPPPGKPVTFYERHPDDHAPAPSVRADLCLFQLSIWALRVEWSSWRTPSPVKGVGRAEKSWSGAAERIARCWGQFTSVMGEDPTSKLWSNRHSKSACAHGLLWK